MPHDALPTVCQPFFAKTGNKGIRLRDQRFSKHTARSLAHNFR